MAEILEISQILELLPHRPPFLFVDRVLDYEPYSFLTAVKNVSMNEPFFVGHFPSNPVMPGVIMLEALAQAGVILSNLSRQPKEGYDFLYFFAGIDDVKFKHIVVPGDQLRLEVKSLSQKREFWKIHGEVYVGETLACTANLLSAAKEIKRDQ